MEAHRPVIGADVAAGADGGLTAGYDLGAFFDEMFEAPGRPRPHYRLLAERLAAMSARPAGGADQGRERVLPHAGHRVHGLRRRRRHRPDLPVRPRSRRIVPADEWETIERGLVQRLRALNLFLADIYHRQQILEAGIVPGRPRLRLAQLPARDDRPRRARRESTPTSAASTSSATATAATSCSRTTCAPRRASATCSRAGRR